jgi:hypothetical protein
MKKISELYNYKDFKAAFIKGDKQWHEKEFCLFINSIQSQKLSNESIEIIENKLKIKLVSISPQKGYAVVDKKYFKFVNKKKWFLSSSGRPICYSTHHTKEKRSSIPLHRFIIGETKEGLQVDHINKNPLDNRRKNLRVVSSSQNMMNREKQINNKSGFKGVSWHKASNKWRATIIINKKQTTIKTCQNIIEAVYSYDVECEKLHGKYASPNFSTKEWKDFILTIKKRAGNELLVLFESEIKNTSYPAPSIRYAFIRGLSKAIEITKKKYKI